MNIINTQMLSVFWKLAC